MRVLSLLFSGMYGGPHNCNLRIAPILKEHGIELVLALPEESGNAMERLRPSGLEIHTIPTHRLRRSWRPSAHLGFVASFLRDVAIIRRLVRERHIDLVLINGVMHPHGAIAARRENVPVVWQIVEDVPAALKFVLMPLVKHYADAVMTTGARLASRYPGLARLSDRVVRFFPPVDLNGFRRDPGERAATREKLNLASDALVIGTIGNLNPDKDHRNFIRAAAELKRVRPFTQFVVLGRPYEHRPEYVEELCREARSLGIEIGRDLSIVDPGADVPRLAQAFDIFWLTSRSEGMPVVIGEAFALSLPAVATDVGSVREAVREGVTGFVVPPGDPCAIVRATLPLLDDPALRRTMGESALRFCRDRFDSRVCAETHLRAFELAATRHAGASQASSFPAQASTSTLKPSSEAASCTAPNE